ncbi:protein SAMBA [Salvia miltiorrhiza]|uniref:protein SAMBA n=1 Tax=Salvia miltiorrhiza TaxID=226208 RepID=UPI0025AD946E|nr:protein SAMBA [Salvia miltiorrhiza]
MSLSAAGAAAVASSATDDGHPLHHELAVAVADVTAISIQDRKDQTLLALKSELMGKLDKEVKSLDDDSWMFDGPRSRINLISRPGGLRHGHKKLSACHDMAPRK